MMNIYNLLLNYNNLMALDKLKLMLNNFPLNIIFKGKDDFIIRDQMLGRIQIFETI